MRFKKIATALMLFFVSFTMFGCASDDNPYKQLYCSHKFKEIDIPATCTEDGVKMEKCSKCGYEKNKEVLLATGHNFAIRDSKEPTCLAEGYNSKICLKCGYEYTEELPLQDHNYSLVTFVSPTCTEDGYNLKECSYCHKTIKVDIVPAQGHKLKTITIQPTCTTNGYSYEKCTTCGLETAHYDIVSALGHDYGEVQIHPLSCTEDGYSYRICQRCHQESEHYDIVKAPGHDLHTITIKPTCTEDGYSYDVCSCCDYVSDHYAIEETQGHVFRIIEKAATCTQSGYLIKECINCDEVEYTQYPALSHDYVERIVPATCTKEGYSHYVCQLCGEEDESIGKYNIQPATGHLPIVSLEAKNPTCQEEGHTSQTSCALCGEILVPSVTIPKSQHAYEEIDRVESTCTVDGYVLLECSVCHEKLQIHEGTTNKHKDFDVDKICDDCGAHLIYSEADFYDIENDMAGTYVLMNDITLSRTTPLGLINGHENETNISQEHATPFTGSLTSNNTNRTISYSYINDAIDTFYVAPIYLNQGLIEGVNCNILDIDFTYEETNIGVDSVTSQSKIVAGLALINQGIIKECGCVDDTNLNLSFKMRSTDAFAGSRVEHFNYYYGGLAYINDSDGIIDQCFNSAYLSLNETASIHHNGRTEDSIKYDQNRRIWLLINSKIGSIAYTNNGSITSSSGSLKMNVSINGILVIVPEKTNILSSLLGDKISEGFGNIVFTTNIAAQQIAFSNNGKINNCYGEVINTASWSVSVAYSGRSQKYSERIRYGVSTNDEWFKYYGENDAPIINTIDLDDEIPEEEVDEGDGN